MAAGNKVKHHLPLAEISRRQLRLWSTKQIRQRKIVIGFRVLPDRVQQANVDCLNKEEKIPNLFGDGLFVNYSWINYKATRNL